MNLLRLSLALAACAVAHSALAENSGMSRAQAYARAAALQALGRQLFFDPSLSASGQMACSTCHDPKRTFGPPNGRDVQLGGKDMKQPGLRAVPSLTYIQVVPQFTAHYYESDDEGDASVDNGPTGGLTWDGRADRGREQARIPLLSPYEMANDDEAGVAAKIRRTGYAGEFAKIYGPDALKDDGKTFAAALEALEVFEQSEQEFYPYSSKYDAYLAGRAKLSEQEARGLALFNDEEKGNCASCHRSAVDNDGTPPQFTDYGLIAIGLPRNMNIPANADPNYFDLGACGPLRTDLANDPEYCGLFRTPSLRNVALRQTFYHNGAEHDLREAVEFYVERDTKPEKWYPRNADGTVAKFNDLPRGYWDNVNMEPPFGGKPGDPPRLSPSEIDDIVAFLATLTDGYRPVP